MYYLQADQQHLVVIVSRQETQWSKYFSTMDSKFMGANSITRFLATRSKGHRY